MTSLARECPPFEGRHTGETIAKGMKVMLKRHGLSKEDVERMVKDNANNVIAGLSNVSHAWIAVRCRSS